MSTLSPSYKLIYFVCFVTIVINFVDCVDIPSTDFLPPFESNDHPSVEFLPPFSSDELINNDIEDQNLNEISILRPTTQPRGTRPTTTLQPTARTQTTSRTQPKTRISTKQTKRIQSAELRSRGTKPTKPTRIPIIVTEPPKKLIRNTEKSELRSRGTRPTSRPIIVTEQPNNIIKRPLTPRGTRPPRISFNSYSAPTSDDSNARILKQFQQIDENGNYEYQFETDNGIQTEELGYPKGLENGQVAEQVSGSYTYTAPNGEVIQVFYTADENGFHPTGSHLPTPPPIPEAIIRAIKYTQEHSHRN